MSCPLDYPALAVLLAACIPSIQGPAQALHPYDPRGRDDTGVALDTSPGGDTSKDTGSPDTGSPDTGPWDTERDTGGHSGWDTEYDTAAPDTGREDTWRDTGAWDTGPSLPMPGIGDLVISEIMVDPYDDGTEWFELYCAASEVVDVGGLYIGISENTGGGYLGTVPAGVTMDPGQYLVVCESTDTSPCDLTWADMGWTSAVYLDNVYGTIELDEPLYTVDNVTWNEMATPPWPMVFDGHAADLDPSAMDATSNDDVTNWCEGTTLMSDGVDYGTPGSANDGC